MQRDSEAYTSCTKSRYSDCHDQRYIMVKLLLCINSGQIYIIAPVDVEEEEEDNDPMSFLEPTDICKKLVGTWVEERCREKCFDSNLL